MSGHVGRDEELPDSAEIQGYVVAGYVASAYEISTIFGDRFEDQLADRGIEDVDSDEWYSAPKVQDAFFETKETIGSQTLVNAGAKTAELADWPDHVTTVEDALAAMDESHQQAHRNVGDADVGGYELVDVDDGAAKIDCTGFPYPREIAEGAIEGTIDVFQSEDSVIKVSRLRSGGELVFETSW